MRPGEQCDDGDLRTAGIASRWRRLIKQQILEINLKCRTSTYNISYQCCSNAYEIWKATFLAHFAEKNQILLTIWYILVMYIRKIILRTIPDNDGCSNAISATSGYCIHFKSDNAFDFIISQAKFFICKINKTKPRLHQFKRYLKTNINVQFSSRWYVCARKSP